MHWAYWGLALNSLHSNATSLSPLSFSLLSSLSSSLVLSLPLTVRVWVWSPNTWLQGWLCLCWLTICEHTHTHTKTLFPTLSHTHTLSLMHAHTHTHRFGYGVYATSCFDLQAHTMHCPTISLPCSLVLICKLVWVCEGRCECGYVEVLVNLFKILSLSLSFSLLFHSLSGHSLSLSFLFLTLTHTHIHLPACIHTLTNLLWSNLCLFTPKRISLSFTERKVMHSKGERERKGERRKKRGREREACERGTFYTGYPERDFKTGFSLPLFTPFIFTFSGISGCGKFSLWSHTWIAPTSLWRSGPGGRKYFCLIPPLFTIT